MMEEASATPAAVKLIGEFLRNPNNPLKARFRALFTLKNINTLEAVEQIGASFGDPSNLLKHELAYCLGQMRNVVAVPILEKLISDMNNHVIVRHEAGEALGAIGTPECLEILKRFTEDPHQEVVETVAIAITRVEALLAAGGKESEKGNEYETVDPIFNGEEDDDYSEKLTQLSHVLLSEEEGMPARYSALFRLRDAQTPEAVLSIAQALECRDSALLRHEVAFVLGQLANDMAAQYLIERLADQAESAMVRHECAEALGAIGTEECIEALEKFLDDPEPLVSESCDVALDISEYNASKDFQYADGLTNIALLLSEPEA